jgi:cytochrome c oxidase subunit II
MSQPRFSRRAAVCVLVVGLGAVLSGCGNNNGQNSLHPEGPAAHKIDNLFTVVFWIAAVIGILVILGTVYMAIRFRHRKGQPDNPKQIHGNTALEIGWTIVPLVILMVVAVPTVATIFELAKKPSGPDVLNVQVVGKQWWWQFNYPGKQLLVGNSVGDTVVTSTELHIPVNTPVYLSQTSNNVIHSFWVPELNGKKDVMPGRVNHNTIEADHPGTYLGTCAEYCGLAHADMRFRVIAQPMDEFKAWLAGQREGPSQPWAGEIKNLTSTKFGCTNCHIFSNDPKLSAADNVKAALNAYAPNLVHLASRSTFAGGTYKLNREDLTKWVMNAPGLIPMQSKYCRLPAPAPCTGMPSFTKNTPKGDPVMTRQDADTIVSYLLGEK